MTDHPFPASPPDQLDNPTLGILASRRTIRKFEDRPVAPETVAAIEDAARQTATSQSLSAWSAIRVKDPRTREAIAQICGHARIARAPLLYVFAADEHRNLRIARAKGVSVDADTPFSTSALFFQAYDDAVLAVHAAETAAESLGLGAVILGAITFDLERVIDLLHLPRHVFPVLGLALGYPAKVPELKPRPPRGAQFFDDVYPDDAANPDPLAPLADFDREVRDYYLRRNPDNPISSFTDYVAGIGRTPVTRPRPIVRAIARQGFATD
ncbi:nitroreductase family protein [Bifidobacterium avesanii]|uniref:NADPH-dependent oxidoreductase n=1 Tax=Bifidobacterium avesanii TaxID=1798157 RepID=A0A7K3TH20_9BIFI|nr:nitroreductase family protein [Bifidobacterium avesanii]KAB8291458.1 NADPH-dependent oxidoreductase [Bifidobacterium avesanii]NEG77910.1 NADPH-dependent oxidoreductase [Bifidobacterium avesanii]